MCGARRARARRSTTVGVLSVLNTCEHETRDARRVGIRSPHSKGAGGLVILSLAGRRIATVGQRAPHRELEDELEDEDELELEDDDGDDDDIDESEDNEIERSHENDDDDEREGANDEKQ